MAAIGNGEVLLGSMGRVNRFDGNMMPTVGPIRFSEGLTDPQDFVADTGSGRVYALDTLKGKVFEFNSDSTLRREIRYRDARNEVTGTYSNHMGLDLQKGGAIVRDSDGVYIVDLADGDLPINQRVSTLPFDQTVEGLIVDSSRRRLHLATITQGVGATITSLDLDTYAQLGNVPLGNQIYRMALDSQRNRLAVNARPTAAYDSAIVLLDLSNLSVIDYQLPITNGGILQVDVAIDTTANQLLVTRADGDNPRVEFYQLPG